MRLRDYVEGVLRHPRRGGPRYDEARRDYHEAMRARIRV